MFFPKENFDDINEVRTAVTAILEQYSDNPELARKLVADSECRIFDIIPLNDDSTAWFFGYGYAADYALRLARNPVTRKRELDDIVALPLYDRAGAGFYAQLACWLGRDFDGGQQRCQRISDSVALVTLPVQTAYEYEEGDDGITNISSALAPGIGHYAVCLKDNSVTAVEAIPAEIAADADVLPVATTIAAALCQGRNIRENFPQHGLEFICPLLPTEPDLGKQRLHLAWQDEAWMITIADYRLLDICKI